ncbi:DUF1801 domain-containing protein [Paenibacillus arenilitoris]|uniref:DUF1801 domain-containing protein n=1 Tax=Paenibacillus arenilitoris TaxID=2772299 RepID=UPI00295C22BC|nr:DUF1801 domain-containing protein [Paenibacillus arenilitoris]
MATTKGRKEAGGRKAEKPTGHERVVAFLNDLEHPLKAEIEEVRSILLSANDRLTEQIKWNAPSFCYENEDRVTFNLRGNGYFLLVFHRGAKAKAAKETYEDETGLLEWAAADRATVKFTDMDDVAAKKEKLAEAVNRWIEY